MSTNCTGYNFFPSIRLCTTGPVGDGQTADLFVDVFSDVVLASLSTETVQAWDGAEVVVDFTSAVGTSFFAAFSENFDSSCEITSAQLTITPDSTDGTTGLLTLEIVINGCEDLNATTTTSSPGTTAGPTSTPAPLVTVFENCGGAGPHTITEMTAFDLSGSAFCVLR